MNRLNVLSGIVGLMGVVVVVVLVLFTQQSLAYSQNLQLYTGQKYESLILTYDARYDDAYPIVNGVEEREEFTKALQRQVHDDRVERVRAIDEIELLVRDIRTESLLIIYLDALGEMGWQLKLSLRGEDSKTYFFFERPQLSG